MVNLLPEGFHTLTPTLVVNHAADAIALYVKVFAAKVEYIMAHPETKRIVHACLLFGNSKIFVRDVLDICEEMPTNARLYLYADDVDAMCKLAVSNGFEQIVMPPEDMFWGDRLGMVCDSHGVTWIVATHERSVSSADMEFGRQELLRNISA